MPLPIAPAPRSDDIAVLDWAGITVRVAWTLIASGVRLRAGLLRDARDHAILHVDPHWTQAQAEDRAATATEAFIARARGRQHATPWPQDDEMPPSPRWRRAFDRSLDPLSRLVLRKHYGEARKLDALEARLQVDRLTLEATRGGLREIVRKAAAQDGLPLENWSVDRIDRLLVRLAAFSPGPCPPASEVIDGFQQGHLEGCPRCDRMHRLVHAGRLTLDDLVAPTLGARPSRRVQVLALHVHPDARRWVREIAADLGPSTMIVDEDTLLVDAAARDRLGQALVARAELGAPGRDRLRGALVEGTGQWSRHGLLGPLFDAAMRDARHRPWGLIDGLGELPPVLPAPPGAAPFLLAAAAMLVLAGWVGRGSWWPEPAEATWPVAVQAVPDASGTWLSIDVDDRARLAVVQLDPLPSVLVDGAHPADKAALAFGDGRYVLHTDGHAALVASLDGDTDWNAWLAHLPTEGAAEALRDRIRAARPTADIALVGGAP